MGRQADKEVLRSAAEDESGRIIILEDDFPLNLHG